MKALVFALLFVAIIYVSESRNVVGMDSTFDTNDESFYEADHKTLLLKAVTDFLLKAKVALVNLSKGSKTELANGLDKVILLLHSMGEKVKSLKSTTEMGKLTLKLIETMAVQGEKYLVDVKAKGQDTHDEQAGTAALLKVVGQIYDEGRAALEKLSKGDKKIVIDDLTKTINLTKELQTQLKSLKTSTELGKVNLEGFINIVQTIQTFLEQDLKAVHK